MHIIGSFYIVNSAASTVSIFILMFENKNVIRHLHKPSVDFLNLFLPYHLVD